MKAYQSSARLTFRNFVKVGFFLFLVAALGTGLAVLAGGFVLGDLSGAWQNTAAVSGKSPGDRLIPVSYIDPCVQSLSNPAAGVVAASVKQSIPAALAPEPVVADQASVQVARAIPVLPDVPVRRAQPVMLTVPRTFNVKAELADDQSIPRARPVSPAELAVQRQSRTYRLSADRGIAQNDVVALNW